MVRGNNLDCLVFTPILVLWEYCISVFCIQTNLKAAALAHSNIDLLTFHKSSLLLPLLLKSLRVIMSLTVKLYFVSVLNVCITIDFFSVTFTLLIPSYIRKMSEPLTSFVLCDAD